MLFLSNLLNYAKPVIPFRSAAFQTQVKSPLVSKTALISHATLPVMEPAVTPKTLSVVREVTIRPSIHSSLNFDDLRRELKVTMIKPLLTNQFLREEVKGYESFYPQEDLSSFPGYDAEKESVIDIIEYLQNPQEFVKTGVNIPKGVILYGPPGSGKTSFAKALAGHAGVPLYSFSATEFLNMYVGESEKMLVNVFRDAKRQPSIIFIDEVETIASKRQAPSDQNYHRNSLVNQLNTLLSEPREGVVVIVATNFIDHLDEAFKRPGRFDKQIKMGLPTLKDRKTILEKLLKDKEMSTQVPIDLLAKISSGYSSAFLVNWINETVKIANIFQSKAIDLEVFDKAKTHAEFGSIQTRELSKEERFLTAAHEAGHAIVGRVLNYAELYKISIVPYGNYQGLTDFIIPEENTETLENIKKYICVKLAGRAAENVISQPSVGSASDFAAAKKQAQWLVEKEGLGSSILGREQDIEDILQAEMLRATDIIKKHKKHWEKIRDALVEHSELLGKDVEELIAGRALKKKKLNYQKSRGEIKLPPSKVRNNAYFSSNERMVALEW